MRYALLDPRGICRNVVAWDGETPCDFGDLKPVLDEAGAHSPQVDVPPPTASDISAAIDAHLDALAQSWGYDDRISLATYHGSTVPRFQAEAGAFVAWRDAIWQQAAWDLSEVTAGRKAQPETVAAYLATLPPAPARP